MPKRSLPPKCRQCTDRPTRPGSHPASGRSELSRFNRGSRSCCRCCTLPPSCASFRAKISRPASNLICKGNHPWPTMTETAASIRIVASPRMSLQGRRESDRVLQDCFRSERDFPLRGWKGYRPRRNHDWRLRRHAGGRVARGRTLQSGDHGQFAGSDDHPGSRRGRLRRARHCCRRKTATPNRRPVLRKARCQSPRSLRIPVERVYGHRKKCPSRKCIAASAQ